MCFTVIDGKVVESRTIPGLHTPYVYFGSRFSTFMMHTEDYDFPAINLHVAGSTKIWYTIDERYADRLEASVRAACRANGLAHAVKCTAFMRHKYFMVTPEFLRAHDIPYTVLCQNPGEIVVTFARVYHQGFNVGFNVNEAVNIATRVSMCHSARAKQCDCCESTKNRKTPVIDLKPVLRRLYGPEQCDKVENGTATFQDETDPLVIAKKKKAKDEIFTEKCEIFFQMTNEERRMAKHRLRPVIPEYAKAWVQHGPPALLSKPFYDRFKRSATIETKKLLAGVGHQTFVGSFRRFICDRIQRQPLEDLIEDADLRRAFQEKYTRSNRLTVGIFSYLNNKFYN